CGTDHGTGSSFVYVF
nr:immunoglobulin light chain junction region [Macaca mulatta]MPO13887.1 immunoglobulin light chain junction region [Macaca mulatta]